MELPGGLDPDLQEVSCLAAAHNTDQVDRFSAAAVFLRVALLPHLGDCGIQRSGRVTVPIRHLELQHEHLPARQYHHVRAAMARCVLCPDIHADGTETHVQEAGIPGLVAGEIAARVPLVGDPRKI